MILVSIILSLVVVAFLAHYNFWRPVKKCSLPRILMYHNTSNQVSSGMNITPELLEKQIQYLIQKQYTFLKISDLPSFTQITKHVVLTFDDGFVGNHTYLFELLKKYKVPATIYLTPDIQGIEALSSSQIKEMQTSGFVEFGAHTMTHVNLTKADNDRAQKEIIQSKEAVEKLTGISCYSFAYPYGRYNEQHVQMVKNAGFTTAVTTKKAIAAFDHSNPYTLPRLSISGCINMVQFYLILSRGRYKL
jgi:peptidoglycan/xylan/chitin deacetylase (PgdA/CDA1 family)